MELRAKMNKMKDLPGNILLLQIKIYADDILFFCLTASSILPKWTKLSNMWKNSSSQNSVVRNYVLKISALSAPTGVR
jgi:hypothetical protein